MFEFRPMLMLLVFFLLIIPLYSIRFFEENVKDGNKFGHLFKEALMQENGDHCPKPLLGVCDPSLVHVAMTLDSKYLRGSVAAIHSILKHASCPRNVYFHFISHVSDSPSPEDFAKIMESTFPSLGFQVYPFDPNRVRDLISPSIRRVLENPLNYARTYLAEILEPCVKRVIYIDSDTITVDDIQKIWSITLRDSRVIGAPEYCHVNFTKYFRDEFWFVKELPKVFEGKMPCYFNTGVMVMDLFRWREGGYTNKIEEWMRIQKGRRIYDLGSLPPFLLVFGGSIEAIDHRWNQHGLGGDNVVHSCRSLHPGPVSLLHWSGKGKPWVRVDEGRHCPVDSLWAPYDLYRGNNGLKHFKSSILDV